MQTEPKAKERERPGQVGSLDAKGGDDDYGGWAKNRWHQMDVERFPRDISEFRDVDALLRDYIIPGHAPAQPVLDAGDTVVTLGSCFARELRNYLAKVGFTSQTFWIPSGLHNSFALLDFISWAVTGEETERGFRYDRFDGGEIREWTPEDERLEYAQRLAEAGAFVLTYSIAEVWEDKETGGVFWRGVPEEIFDADRHVFRLSTVEENLDNILRTVALIRQINPKAPIVLTLSPGSIAGSFRGISCMTADCVSKSVLRVALDQVIARGLEDVYYWPGFELVKWAGPHFSWEAYGLPDGRAAHASRYLVDRLMDAFVEAYYAPEAVAEMRANRTWRREPHPHSLRGRAQRLGWVAKRRKDKLVASLAASPTVRTGVRKLGLRPARPA